VTTDVYFVRKATKTRSLRRTGLNSGVLSFLSILNVFGVLSALSIPSDRRHC